MASQKQNWQQGLWALVFVIALVGFGGLYLFSQSMSIADDGGSGLIDTQVSSEGIVTQIIVTDDPMAFGFVSMDMFNRGTAVGSVSVDVFDEDNALMDTDLLSTETINLDKGGSYTFVATVANYHPTFIDDYTAPALKDTDSIPIYMAYYDSGMTVKVLDEDDDLNADTTNEIVTNNSLGADDSTFMTISLRKGTSDRYLVHPDINMFAVILDLDEVADWDTTAIEIAGCKEISVPRAYAGTGDLAFKCDGNVWQDEPRLDLIVELVSDDTNTPDAGEDINGHIAPYAYYVDAEDGEVKIGTEDESGTAIVTDIDFVFYV